MEGTQAEAALIAAIVIDAEFVFGKLSGSIQAKHFSERRGQVLFEALQQLHDESSSVNVLTLADKLRTSGNLEYVGGPAALTELANEFVNLLGTKDNIRIVRNDYKRRKLVKILEAVASATKDVANADDLVAEAEQHLAALSIDSQQDDSSTYEDILFPTLDRITALQGGQTKQGIPTGYRQLDTLLTGFQDSDLLIFAARPSVGKTSMALNLARNAVKQGIPVLIFSLEMSKEQLVERLLAMETGISTDRLRSGELSEQEYQYVIDTTLAIHAAPLFIDDRAALDFAAIRSKSRRDKRKHGIKLIIIDYLQLMSGNRARRSDNREQEIAEISRGLKMIAKELNLPVIALSQLSRQVESRTPPVPMLSDLRESGSIEQNADVVGLLYRDDYYDANSLRKGLVDLIIKKHRNGKTGGVEFYFDRKTQRFHGLSASQ